MPEVLCKSDCEFANNDERKCALGLIELSQANKESPIFNCQQYVQGNKPNARFILTDIDRARTAGLYSALEEEYMKK